MASKLSAFLTCDALLRVVFILLSLYQRRANGDPTGTLVPSPENNVLEGNTAEFTCSVNGRNGEILKWQGFDRNGMTGFSFFVDALLSKQSFPSFLPGFSTLNYGTYYTSHTIKGDTEILMLRIVNVTRNEDGFEFNCLYNDGTGSIVIGIWSQLIVWTKPTIQPQCDIHESFTSGPIPGVISGDMEYRIRLSCILPDGDPLPTLTWFEVVNNQNKTLNSTMIHSTNQANLVLNIGTQDYGREFLCVASVAGTLDESLSCRLIPYNPMPVITITSGDPMIASNNSVSLTCTNTGTTTNDIIYNWYVDSDLISDRNGIVITQSNLSTTLVIEDPSFLYNNKMITCEGVIPGGPSANASVVVPTSKPSTTTMPPGSDSRAEMTMIIIIAAAAGGGSIVVVLIVLIVCLVRRPHRTLKTDADNRSFKMATVYPNNDETTVPGHDSMRSKANGVTSGSSPNSAAIYALPNKGQTSEESADTPTYTLPDKTKTTRHITQYEDVGSPSIYDDVSGTNKPHNESTTGRSKADANTEGLTYADLDISRPVDGNDALKDEILGKDEITVYSQLKI